VVDTDILVDALRRFSAGLDHVEEASQQGALRISTISEMELIIGCRNRRELRRLERFLRRCTILGLTEAIAVRTVTLLRQYRLSHHQSLHGVSSIMVCQDCRLVIESGHTRWSAPGLRRRGKDSTRAGLMHSTQRAH